MVRSCLLALVLLLALACSSGEGVGKLDGGATIEGYDPAVVARTFLEASCEYEFRCRPLLAQFYKHGDREACINDRLARQENDLNFFIPALAAGRIKFSQEKLDACRAEASSVDCILGRDDNSPCNDIFLGQQAMGAPCLLSAECAPDFFCSRPMIGACGTCEPVARAGQDCNERPCGRNLGCLDTGSSFVCINTAVGEGATCGSAASGQCRGELQCVGGPNTGTCTRPAQPSAACDPMQTMGPSCNIFGGYACSMNMCAPLTLGGVGADCSQVTTDCNEEGWCPDATTCKELPGDGEACAGQSGECREGHFCGSGGTCQEVKSQGDSCSFVDECADELTCIGAPNPGMCGLLTWMQCG
jgi:hypothetical protein